MKKTLIVSALLAVSATVSAQEFFQDYKNSEMLRPCGYQADHRKEIVLPQVNGYNVYKADLHSHTVFSDGQVMPELRVREAWKDGLDVIAITDHIEYRKNEAAMVEHLVKYADKKHKEAVNHRIPQNGEITKDGIMVDLNYSVKLAQKAAKGYGLTIIPGTEITRDVSVAGHYNALFTTDNNLIFAPDTYQSIKNAKAQGALIMHNHPGWRKTSLDYSDLDKIVYEEGLIDGVEVMNGDEFYPGIIERTVEKNIFISANTDIHSTTSEEYRSVGYDRPMTLILAKDKSLESLREALEQNRTLAFGFGTLCGAEQLLKDFFSASVKVEHISSKVVQLTNLTSVSYTLQKDGSNQVVLPAMSSIRVSVAKDAKTLDMAVLNMWCGTQKHPVVEIQL